jgi:hypothetical protein
MTAKENVEKEKSSFLKGIDKLLENSAIFEREIVDYILSVNSKFHSNTFPTTQLAKILMNKLKFKQTQYPIIHKVIREIFKKWEDQDLCKYISTSKAGRNRRTKDIYKFTEEQINVLKAKRIDTSIAEISDETLDPKKDIQQMLSRDEILKKIEEQVESLVSEMDDEDLDEDDEDLDEDDEDLDEDDAS